MHTLRFYDIDGNEIDVQDINFHVDKEELTKIKTAVGDLLDDD